MQLVLGADCGGSRTRVALARLDGEVVASGDAGPANPHDVGWEGAGLELAAARRSAYASLGLAASPAIAAVVGIAGVASAAEQERALSLAGELALARISAVRVLPDLEIAWIGAFAGLPGIVLVAGTGSVAYGRDASGQEARAGGWGPRIDDAGSATWIARRALAAAARACDGRESETRLVPALSEALRCADFFALREKIAARELPREELASLARHVVEAARAGDAAARAIVEASASELASLVAAVARRLELLSPAVACVGGLVASDSPLRMELARALRRALPEHEPRAPLLPPVGGALIAALDIAGVVGDATRLARTLS